MYRTWSRSASSTPPSTAIRTTSSKSKVQRGYWHKPSVHHHNFYSPRINTACVFINTRNAAVDLIRWRPATTSAIYSFICQLLREHCRYTRIIIIILRARRAVQKRRRTSACVIIIKYVYKVPAVDTTPSSSFKFKVVNRFFFFL